MYHLARVYRSVRSRTSAKECVKFSADVRTLMLRRVDLVDAVAVTVGVKGRHGICKQAWISGIETKRCHSTKNETLSDQNPSKNEEMRGYTSQTYDESNSIDFHEESHSDYHVPLKEFERVSKENGELRTQLDLYQGFFLAEIVRCTLEKFVEKILKPQNYLKPGTKETAENIEKAFVAFLSDDTNDLAVQLKTLLISLDIMVIANCSRLSYKKTSKIVHRALESYLDDYDVTALYTNLEKAPRFKDEEKLVVNKILELLYNNNLL